MSAYLSLITNQAGYLFADGAGYDDEGVIGAFTQKVAVSEHAPLAVTTLGNAWLGERFRSGILQMVERFGVDLLIEGCLPSFLASMSSDAGWVEMTVGHGTTAAHIVAFSPTRGLVHFGFQTVTEVDGDTGRRLEAYHVNFVDDFYAARGAITAATDFTGLRQKRPEEHADDYCRYFGRAFMEKMRLEKGRSLHLEGTDAPFYHTVGGHIDMAVVTPDGARLERIHVWPEDKVGEKIKPRTSVVVFEAPVSKRARRRATWRVAA